jgi:AcrR family transcriptional regulator
MNATRAYDMTSRRAAADATRERILQAAVGAFLEHWYDEVTVQGIAQAAGVSGQTVLNHFGGKEPLFAATVARLADEVTARRESTPGDVDGAIDALIGDYEVTGDAVIRALATEQRVEAVRPMLAQGRSTHCEWVEAVFERPDLVPELLAATDVYSWKLLRRDRGLSRAETCRAMKTTVRALLALDHETEENPR